MEFENDTENPHQSLKLSTSKAPEHHSRVLIYGIAALLIFIITLGTGYFIGVNKYSLPGLVTTTPTPINLGDLHQNSTDSISDWKTYSNSSLGFSFSYPMILDHLYDQFGFNHPDNPEGNLLLQNYDGSKPRQDQSTDFQMVVEAYKNSDQVTLDKYVKDPNKAWNQSGVQTFANITLGNEPALKGLAIQKNEKVPAIWVSRKEYILTIYLETPKSTNASLFDQILLTFKFTDQLDTSTWKTYTSSVYQYTFQYPPDYTLMVGERSSVDGVKIKTPNTVTLQSPTLGDLNTNMQISILYEKSSGVLSEKMVMQKLKLSSKGEVYQLDTKTGYIFKDTPNGPYGSTMIYIPGKNNSYTITIESQLPYKDIEQFVNNVLSTFKFTN